MPPGARAQEHRAPGQHAGPVLGRIPQSAAAGSIRCPETVAAFPPAQAWEGPEIGFLVRTTPIT